MSKRRKVDDIVRKSFTAGFIKEACVIRLVELETDPIRLRYPSHCILKCGDDECREWDNVEVLENDEVAGYLHHISECQMEDL